MSDRPRDIVKNMLDDQFPQLPDNFSRTEVIDMLEKLYVESLEWAGRSDRGSDVGEGYVAQSIHQDTIRALEFAEQERATYKTRYEVWLTRHTGLTRQVDTMLGISRIGAGAALLDDLRARWEEIKASIY